MCKLKLAAAMLFTVHPFVVATASAAELSGAPEELRNYLQSETRTVTIHKEASEKAYTDIATATLVITTEERKLADSMQSNKDVRAAVIAALKQAGLSDDDIKSAKYSASPQFGWFGDDPNSFEVVNRMTATIDTEAEFQATAGIADAYNEVRFASVEFEHSEKAAYESKARDKALNEVLEDAAYFGERLGLELTPIQFHFSEVRADKNRFGLLEEVVVTARKSPGSAMLAPSAAPPPTPGFDEIEYKAAVGVTFAVSPAE